MFKTKPSILLAYITMIVVSSFVVKPTLAQAAKPSRHTDSGIHYATVTSGQHKVFYAHSGNRNNTGLLFIHGTPGGWGAFKRYLKNKELQRDFFMVSLDRPGWGNSPLPAKLVDGNFATQSQGVGSILRQHPEKQWILVGHSLGASIAPQIAMDYPNQVKGLLLLAGSLKPSLGSPRWYNYAANTWAVATLIGKSMKYSNREIMGLRKQLKTMDQQLKSVKLPAHVVILQGKKDRLVSPKNSDYAKLYWQSSFASLRNIELEKEGHFLPWRQAPLVEKLIYDLSSKPDIQ